MPGSSGGGLRGWRRRGEEETTRFLNGTEKTHCIFRDSPRAGKHLDIHQPEAVTRLHRRNSVRCRVLIRIIGAAQDCTKVASSKGSLRVIDFDVVLTMETRLLREEVQNRLPCERKARAPDLRSARSCQDKAQISRRSNTFQQLPSTDLTFRIEPSHPSHGTDTHNTRLN